MNIKRGQIFLAGLDPVMGNEISKTRPAVVVSNDIGNQYSGTVTIVKGVEIDSKKTNKFI